MNAASGTDITKASTGNTLTMPKVMVVAATDTPSAIKLTDIVADTTPEVIGLFGAGANSERLTASTTENTFAGETGKFKWDASKGEVTLPASGTDKPVNYLIKFDRTVKSGIQMSNSVNNFPKTVSLTLYCSYVDPCDDELKACYVVLPSFQASPETTISLDAENQEIDFTGSIQVDYCATNPTLYTIYLPEENAVKTGVVA